MQSLKGFRVFRLENALELLDLGQQALQVRDGRDLEGLAARDLFAEDGRTAPGLKKTS